MYTAVKIIHSYWAYLVVLVVFLATLNALIGFFAKKEYGAKDFRIALFALIVTHLQLLIGIVIFFVSPTIMWFNDTPVKTIMKDPLLRLYNVEHPMVMIVTVLLITIGYSKHKKKRTSTPKLKVLSIFYTLAFILMLSRIPWASWL